MSWSRDEFLVTHNFSPFIDERPGVAKDVRYKGLGGGALSGRETGAGGSGRTSGAQLIAKHGPGGLYAFGSGDGIHWTKLQEEPGPAGGVGVVLILRMWPSGRRPKGGMFVTTAG